MPTNDNHPLAELVTANPILIDPSMISVFDATLAHLASSEDFTSRYGASAVAEEDFWSEGDDAWFRPYQVKDGILQIPVQGVLLHRFPYQLGRWATGYKYIEQALQRGIDDSSVKGIALVVDSPGGEVAGCFELADKIFEARGEKPIRAFASDHAYSAAYALASSAPELVVSRSGGTGSVGVVTAHVDYSGALEQAGIKVTFIFAGKHKVDGNAYEPLPDSVKGRIQDRIDRLYGVFTSTVARNRGLEESDVRATEALTFDAQDSVAKGFADRVGELDEELVAFGEEATLQPKEETMADKTQSGADQPTMFTQEQVDSAVAAATTKAAATARTEEKARITAILGSDEGKARPKAALSLAMKSSDNAEAVVSMLADMPEEKAEAAPTNGKPKAETGTPFDDAMDASGNPNVGADGGGDDDMDDEDAAAAAILTDLASVRGKRTAAGRK